MKYATLDSIDAMREAGIATAFMWEESEDSAVVDYTTVIGRLPQQVNNFDAYLVLVEGTATSRFGYSYPIHQHVIVSLGTDGVPCIDDATDDDKKRVIENEKLLACREYTRLRHIIQAGTYTVVDGSFWYEGENITVRMRELDNNALDNKLHYVQSHDGTYVLECATQAEIDAYQLVKQAEDDEE